ncbi:ATP-dependent DNA helicase PIF4-like [Salvia splendens]|uniref:ATP-dependent DNA helicase PIF4-like n=1 Tax=Salvia splendens TaxID=180675 RepID=UPI001C264002|nr:ATP-dependent DNA helicase PIF4-like [Salvia splendens]
MEELSYDREALARDHAVYVSKFNDEQRHVYDSIIQSVDSGSGEVFFVYGSGGTGKTFMWSSLSAVILCRGEIVLNVASSGIASLLLLGGRTTHSRFKIPINVTEDSFCCIKQGSSLAELIVRTKLIIWNEAPMMHKYCFEALDRNLRDLMRCSNQRSPDLPFGGITDVFCGDFRQILPVILKCSRQDVVNGTIYIWDYCKVLSLTKNMRLLNVDSGTKSLELVNFLNG